MQRKELPVQKICTSKSQIGMMIHPSIRLLVFIPLIPAIFVACSSSSGEESIHTVTSADSIRQEVKRTDVRTIVASNRAFVATIGSNGKVRSIKEQQFIAQAAGEIIDCNAASGGRYTTGALIVKMDTALLEIRMNRAMQTLFNSQKEYESLLLGYENLLKDKDYGQAVNIKKKLRISTGVLAAEQDVKEAAYELSKCSIRAPFDGILSDVVVRKGQLVKPGDVLFNMYDPDHLVLETKVLESDLGLLKKDMEAVVSPVPDPGSSYSARVYEINPAVGEDGMVGVKLRIDRPDIPAGKMVLFPGMNCLATIKVPLGKALVVPRDAVVMRSGRAVVFTMENGVARWNYVTMGRENGSGIEIKEGLRPGAVVITTNNLQLSHDAPVREIADSVIIDP